MAARLRRESKRESWQQQATGNAYLTDTLDLMLPAVRIGIIEPATNSMRHAMEAVLPVFRSVSLRPSRLAPRQSPAVGTILDSRAQFAAYTPLCGAQSPSHALLPLELI